MKKLFSLLLILTICLSACSKSTDVQNDNTTPATQIQSKTIELTPSNFRNYFEVSCSYGELESYKKNGITFTWVETILKIYPVKTGTLNNIEVTLEITPPAGWSLNSSDPAYSTVDAGTKAFTVKIRVPASGEYSETHRLGSVISSSKPYTNCSVKIVSVSGTFEG